ncbi:MAG TPA: DUF1080 domain-containing protein [Magnetospirillaceae bacterium]|nr:DUF1080 domain-containing protein [Magnetospirillaceae bacterium]
MRKLIALVLAAGLLGTSAFAAENTLSAKEKADGWVLLFDGKTTHGWRSYKNTEAGRQWQVIDGVLTLTAGGGGDLVTDKDYANFELSFDWRISKKGNSGVMYHVSEDGGDHPYLTGPEYQLLDNVNRDEPPLEQAGSLFALVAPSKDVTKKIGEFNHSVLKVDHNHVEHWLNGVKVVEYTLGSEDLQARIKGSKFATWPDFAKYDTGLIALQDHGDGVAFRNIKIHVLP